MVPTLYVYMFHYMEGNINGKVVCVIFLSDDLVHQYLLIDIPAMLKSADDFLFN